MHERYVHLLICLLCLPRQGLCQVVWVQVLLWVVEVSFFESRVNPQVRRRTRGCVASSFCDSLLPFLPQSMNKKVQATTQDASQAGCREGSQPGGYLGEFGEGV